LRVSREKRAKGKVVTVVSGLDATASDRDAILKQLKAACGSGGAVKDGHIEVQGDHRERVMDALKILGYPVKMSGG
jgi:translation initiation factor 1